MLALGERLADCGSGRVVGVVWPCRGTNATTGAGGREVSSPALKSSSSSLPRHRAVPRTSAVPMHQSGELRRCRALSCGMLSRSGVPAAVLGLLESSAYIHDCEFSMQVLGTITFQVCSRVQYQIKCIENPVEDIFFERKKQQHLKETL